MSRDGKRMVTGDSSGVLRLWDTDHGSVLGVFEGRFQGEAAACCFLDGSKDVILGADNEGTVCKFVLGCEGPAGPILQCDAAATYLRQLHEGSNAVQEALSPYSRVPRLYPPIFSGDGRKMVQALSMRTDIRKMFPEVHVFLHLILDDPETGEDSSERCRASNRVSELIHLEANWSLVSDIKFSPTHQGLLLTCAPIPPNECYEGREIEEECYVVVWPNLKKPQLSIMLPGRMGQWSPDGNWIVTWTLNADGINDCVRVFSTTGLMNGMLYGMCDSASSKVHPRFSNYKPELQLRPQWPRLMWCELILPDDATSNQSRSTSVLDHIHPDFTGWKLAACIGAPEDVNLRVVIWDMKNLAKIHVLETGVSFDTTLVAARYDVKTPAAMHLEWGTRRFLMENSYRKISVSHDSKWIAFYSCETNVGVVWRLDWGTPVMNVNVTDSLIEDKWTTCHVLQFDRSCSKLFLTGEESTVLFVPGTMTPQSVSGPQMRSALAHNGKKMLELGSGEGSSAKDVSDWKSGQMGMTSFKESHVGDVQDSSAQLKFDECVLSHDGSVLALKGQKGIPGRSMKDYGPLFWSLRSKARIDADCRFDSQQGFALSPSGDHFVLVSNANSLIVGKTADLSSSVPPDDLKEMQNDPKWLLSSLCFSRDVDAEELVVAFSRQRRGVLFWIDIVEMREIERKDAGLRQCKGIQFCLEGTRAVLTNLQVILIWDLVNRVVLERIDFKVNISQVLHTLMFKSGGSSGMGLIGQPQLSCDGQNIMLLWDKENSQPIMCTPSSTMRDLEDQFLKSSGSFSSDYIMSDDARWVVVAEAGVLPEGPEIVRRVRIFDLWGRCPVRELRDWKYNSTAPQIFSVSSDGRMVVSKSAVSSEEEGLTWLVDDLNCWTPYSCEECLPDYGQLCVNKRGQGEEVIDQLLTKYGWPIINNCDWSGKSVFCHAATGGNLTWVQKMLDFAKASGVLIGMHWQDKETSTRSSALQHAIDDRSLEVVDLLVEGVLGGGTSCLAAAEMFKESLMPLGTVFPDIFQEILEEKSIARSSGRIVVPSDAFEKSSVGYLVGTDDGTPQWKDMSEEELVGLWIKINPELRSMVGNDGPRVVGQASWVVCADIAQVGMKGIIRPLLMHNFANEVFGYPPVRWTLDYKWQAYARKLFIHHVFRYTAIVFMFSVYGMLIGYDYEGTGNGKDYKSASGIFGSLCLVASSLLSLVNLRHEISQMSRYYKDVGQQGLVYWASSFWNWMDLVSYMLLLAIVAIEYGVQSETRVHILAVLVPVAAIALWSKFLYYAQAFQTSGPMVIMITEIAKDMFVFSGLLALVVIGFGIAFFVLFNLDPGRSDAIKELRQCENNKTDGNGVLIEGGDGEMCEEGAGEVSEGFSTIFWSLLTMFNMMLGEFDIEAFMELKLYWLALAFFIIYMVVILIVLLNLLIAIMGDTFDRVKGTEETQFLLGRADVIDDIEAMLSDREITEIESKIGKYLHVLEPAQGLQRGAGEWKGKMVELENKIRQLVDQGHQQISNSLSTHIQGLRKEVLALAQSS